MHALPSQNLFMVSWALTVTFFSCCYTDMVLNYSRQYSARLKLQNLFLFIPRVNGTVETELFDMSTSLVKYGKSSFTEIKYPWHAESYDLKVLFAESWSQDLVSRLLKIKYFTCKVLKCLRLYAESTTVFFFGGGGRKPLKGGKNVRWNNVVTNSKQHESAVTRNANRSCYSCFLTSPLKWGVCEN